MIVAESRDVTCDDTSPDGSWLLYSESEPSRDGAASLHDSVRLMRRPMSGGVPQKVLTEAATFDFWCSSNPNASSPCVLSQLEGEDLVFYSVDPVRGKGNRVGSIRLMDPKWLSWTVSPDGSRLAIVVNGRIKVLILADRSWHEIPVQPGVRPFVSIAWAADGKSFFATSNTLFPLLHVTLDGKVQPLLRNERKQWLYGPLASPDGKYLAFRAQTWDSNVWMIDNF